MDDGLSLLWNISHNMTGGNPQMGEVLSIYDGYIVLLRTRPSDMSFSGASVLVVKLDGNGCMVWCYRSWLSWRPSAPPAAPLKREQELFRPHGMVWR